MPAVALLSSGRLLDVSTFGAKYLSDRVRREEYAYFAGNTREAQDRMLFVLLPLAWIAVVTVLVVLCRMAARADATSTPAADPQPHSGRGGLVLFETPPMRTLATIWTAYDVTHRRQVGPPRPRRSSRSSRRTAAHGIR